MLCGKLTSVILPQGLRKIGSCAFKGCGLSSVKLPYSLTSIDDEAFSSCKKLIHIELPAGLQHLGSSVFRDCRLLKVPWIENGLTYWRGGVTTADSDIQTAVIREGTERISANAFHGCDQLTEVFIPDSVRAIDAMAFRGCPLLNIFSHEDGLIYWKNILIGADPDITDAVIKEGTTAIATEAFNGCNLLESVSLPASVSEIGCGAFSSCRNLAEAVLPVKVTVIHDDNFSWYEKLTSAVLPPGLKCTADSAFLRCQLAFPLRQP